ncbi:extracellular solute-binding protein [Neisseria sp. Ec49-e6-T10]|uniref:extracellular solute-binding protein n=1 Tax=Neisseria sp. Ec49-e6-T10 TaxID=3140744 RepID=UPI003EC0076D
MKRLLQYGVFVGALCQITAAFADFGVALGYEPKYQPGFTHFDYVNPQAPKGGSITFPSVGGFDSLNPFALKGDKVSGVDTLVVETLLTASEDEPFSAYGLLAQDVVLAPDGLSVTFTLNRTAKFHNNDPVLAEDVVYSFQLLTQNQAANPLFRFYWEGVKKAYAVDRYTVRFEFKQKNSELHMILGQLPVFSHKSFPDGFEKSNQAPIGSGPYKIKRVNFGKSIEFERDIGYWAQNLPSRKGMYNFDLVHFKYYKDDVARMEAFKAGQVDVSVENIAKNWARAYNGKNFDDKKIVKDTFVTENGAGLQGFVFNTRKPFLQDRNVRKALSLAFDFEWVNRQLFYNLYVRSYSYFTNSELAAKGKPTAEELKLLLPLKNSLPKEVFEEDVPQPPISDPKLGIRPNLLQARKLLLDAGYRYQNGLLVDAKGVPLKLEFVSFSRVYERVSAKWQKDLAKIGVTLTVRVVDPAVYQQRLNDFDYDMTIVVYAASQSPGNEQLNFHSCAAAKTTGSDNWAGYCNPQVDKLLQNFTHFENRAQLMTAAHALDRVLLNEYLVVPNWYPTSLKIAWWNRFSSPQQLPKFYQGQSWVLETWWATSANKGS